MENKDKIIEIINACVDNKEFYSKDSLGKSRILIGDHNYWSKNKRIVDAASIVTKNKINGEFVPIEQIDIRKWERTEEYNRLIYLMHHEKLKYIKQLYSDIRIEFKEQPPIELYIRSRPKEIQNILFTKETITHKTIQQKNWFGKIKKLIQPEYELKSELLEEELYGYIKMGTIYFEVPFEFINSIGERYMANRKIMEQELDFEKLESRYKEFVPQKSKPKLKNK